VLTYAAWEGFYNECVDTYCSFLRMRGKKVSDVEWKMIVGVLNAEFESLRNRNHSRIARRDFVQKLQAKLVCDFASFDATTVKARSNLDWEKLDHNFQILNFDLGPLQRHRHRLDVEIVGWRHGVAHGSAPSLSTMNAADHITLVGEVMMLVADAFQSAMLAQI
jgi:hypothetical protein